ncbi:hypothetical protein CHINAEXTREME_17210 [Halobiforma lacisalsi AJ5]|uniref:Uncharacterized protein n=1 Tax=Natronobacterium lacisalsi AJ5 TaxID=358396 RepID=M0LP23_NATLA|nr:hypothetical protein [Halobiforma lacisalsi]APX00131.1 hypothetical protein CHINAEXTREME_17210 [Halobiforma lacisalsi AJ5]EMA35297.1 hypothetical protein C445_05573 [Halobiforma lacisalsi AJ5]
MQINQSAAEQETPLHDELEFVEKQDVPAGEKNATKDNYAYRIEGPGDRVIFIQGGTQFSPEFRDAEGNQLDGSARVTFQKCTKQGDPISEYVFNEQLGRFDYSKMRTNPEYQRYTKRDLMLDEREIAKIYVQIPDSGEAFDASNSTLVIGDDTSDFGTPVEIINHDDLTAEESQAIKAASQRGE